MPLTARYGFSVIGPVVQATALVAVARRRRGVTLISLSCWLNVSQSVAVVGGKLTVKGKRVTFHALRHTHIGLPRPYKPKRVGGALADVRVGSLADTTSRWRYVRFTPIADIRQCRWDFRKVPTADKSQP